MRGREDAPDCCCTSEPPPAKKRISTLCDGSKIQWIEQWVSSECGECGHIASFDEIAEPDRHVGKVEKREDGERVWACCGEILADFALVNQIAIENYMPVIEEMAQKNSPLLAYLKGKR